MDEREQAVEKVRELLTRPGFMGQRITEGNVDHLVGRIVDALASQPVADEWAFTTETVTREQYNSLKSLLDLKVKEGPSVTFEDEPVVERQITEEVEALREQVKELCAYVKEAAGDESVLVPVSTLASLVPRYNEPLLTAARAVLDAYNKVSLRKAQHQALDGPLAALEAALGAPPRAGRR